MSKIINLSEAASLALHSMVLVAKSKEQLNATQIAEITGSSRNHLAKIMQQLVKKDFLISNRGPTGGFSLKKEPKDITILEIYESVEGKLEISPCPLNHQVCAFDKCLMGNLVKKVTEEFIEYFKNQTLQDFVTGNY